MKFLEFSNYLEKLEATTKRLELIDIMADLFRNSQTGEVEKICYLLQGRVAPFYKPIEMGMAESMVAQAIAKAYGKSKEDVLQSYRRLGNMGLAAQDLADKRNRGGNLSVSEVFADLLKIANTGGEGSVERKIAILGGLLENLDSTSVKHVVNIPLGTLRLGIGDPTVMDALSIARVGDKKMRSIIEDAYNKTSDLGYVAEIFYLKGEKGLADIKLVVGKPVRPALAERLPNADEVIKRVGGDFAAEPKFDGFRVQVHKDGNSVEIFSRNLENMTHAFPDLVDGIKREIKAKTAILEGEAIAYNPQTEEFLPFQETTKRRRKHGVVQKAKELPLVMFAFDVLYFNGDDVTEKHYVERRKILEKIIDFKETIRISESRKLHNAKEILEFFNECVSEGLEGLMIKKLDSPYKAGGRGFHWIKFKRASSGELTDTIDCVLVGVYGGRGKRTEFGVGGLLVAVYNKNDDVFETICRIGTGLTDDEFRHVNDIGKKLKLDHKSARVRSNVEPTYWVEPEVVLEVYADEITKSPIHVAGWDEKTKTGYALRFPRLVKFREKDKVAEDATTVSEIEKLFSNQYGKK